MAIGITSLSMLALMAWQLADQISGGRASKGLGNLLGFSQEDEQAPALKSMIESASKTTQLQMDASKLAMKMVKDMEEVYMVERKRQFDIGTQLQRESTQAEREVGLTESVMGAMPQLTQYQPQFLVPFNPQYPNASSIVVPGQL